MKKQILITIIFLSLMSSINAQWVTVNNGLLYHDINAMVSQGNTIFAGNHGGVVMSTDNGSNWTSPFAGPPTYCLATNGSYIYAAGYAFFALSTNNGNSWSMSGYGLSGQPFSALAANGNNIFVGSASAGIFFSSDSGRNFVAIDSGLNTSNVFVSLAVSDSNVYAGTVSGGAFFSSDNGSTWSEINNGLTNNHVYSFAIYGTDVFAGTDEGVFFSSDSGSNWFYTGLTGIEVHSLLIAGNYIFAGTNAGVFFSSDEGGVWNEMNDGLTFLGINALATCGDNIFAGGNGIYFRPLSEFSGIENPYENISDFDLYPNPANERFFITIKDEKTAIKNTLSIYNIHGQLLMTQSLQQTKTEINISGLSPGFYIVQVAGNKRVMVKRFVKI